MKKCTLLIASMLLVFVTFAQNPNTEYSFAFKVYNLARYEERNFIEQTYPVGLNYLAVKTDDFHLLHPTFAFQWKTKKNNFQEVELTDLRWQNNQLWKEMRNDSIKNGIVVYAEDITQAVVQMRYEYILMCGKKKERKLVPSVGFAGSPYLVSTKSSPRVSSAFGTTERHTGLNAYVVPRLNWFVGKRMFLDLNVPLCVASAEFTKTTTEDPGIVQSEREVSTLDFRMFPKLFSARVGLGIKF